MFRKKERWHERDAIFEIWCKQSDLAGRARHWSDTLGKRKNPHGIPALWSSSLDCRCIHHALFVWRVVLDGRPCVYSDRNDHQRDWCGTISENEQEDCVSPQSVENRNKTVERQCRTMRWSLRFARGGQNETHLQHTAIIKMEDWRRCGNPWKVCNHMDWLSEVYGKIKGI